MKKYFCPFLLCAVIAVIYFNAINGPFQFDDIAYIKSNPAIRQLSFDVIGQSHFAHPTRLVGYFSFALNYLFHQYEVQGYHIVNIVIHMINSCLVFWLLQLLLSISNREVDQYEKPKQVAFFIALIFATHPIQTQAVTYITQRFTSLAVLFYLLCLCFYIYARISDKKKTFYFILAGASAIFAVFTKQISLTIPAMLLLIEFCFFEKIRWKTLSLFLIIAAIIPALYGFRIMRMLFIDPVSSESHLGDFITSGSYLLTQFKVVVTYLRLLFLPIAQRFDYDYPLSYSLLDSTTLISFFVLLGILLLGIFTFKRNRMIAFGIFWFFITLLVESSVIPIRNVIFEHRLYLPSIGFVICMVFVLIQLISDRRKLLVIVSLIVLTACTLVVQRNRVWQNEIVFWKDSVHKSNHKPRPYLNLAQAYIDYGKNNFAIEALDTAIKLNPSYALAYNKRGILLGAQQNYKQALNDLSLSIKLNPNQTEAYLNRGVVYQKLRQLDQALADFNKAIELSPTFAKSYHNRASLYADQKRYELALLDFNQALELDDRLAGSYINRAVLYSMLNKYDLALADYNKAIEIDSNNANAYLNRANLYQNLEEYEKSLKDYAKAIDINKNFVSAYLNRGILFGATQEYDRAILEFNRTLAIDPNNSAGYFNRSLAYYALKEGKQALNDALMAKKLGYPLNEDYLKELRVFIR